MSVLRSYLFSNLDIYPLLIASLDMMSWKGLHLAGLFFILHDQLPLSSPFPQSVLNILLLRVYEWSRTLPDFRKADYKHLQSQKADTTKHLQSQKADTTNICSPKKRTLQNICSLKKRTLQNICSPKKRTLQNICNEKGSHYILL